MKNPIIALDFSTREQVETFLNHFPSRHLSVKVGMELFYAEGPLFIDELKQRGCKIFLDLKLHDIPNTVKKAMIELARLGVDMVNVHAAGGLAMMEAAREGLEIGSKSNRPRLIAVTQLTSTSEEEMKQNQLIAVSLLDSVIHYSQLAEKAGLDGVVSSALEARKIKETTRADFYCVTPGIRLKEDGIDDQKRVVTPKEARELGASSIVVGRSITNAKNPVLAYETICKEWFK